MEGSHPKRSGFLGRNKGSDTLSHLSRCLIGKGQSKDIPRLHSLLQEIGNLVGKDTRLATTRSRYDERRSIDAKHRFTLAGI